MTKNNEAVITNAEIETLNAARTALKDIAQRNFDTTVHGTAIAAEHVVFSVLNHASTYGGADLTQEQIHGRAKVPA